jgi:putative FmdB family regulatory protein
MPIFEFRCRRCGGRFELLVQAGSEALLRCPECDSEDVEKLVSVFGIGGGVSRLKSSASGCQTCSTKTCSTCK